LKSQKTKAKPLTDPADLDRLRAVLTDRPRDLLLFDLTISSGLPSTRLLGLRVADLTGVPAGGKVTLNNGPGPAASFRMTSRIVASLRRYMDHLEPKPEDFLFKSRKGGQPLSPISTSRLVKGWFTEAGLEGYAGLMSLRRTAEAAAGLVDNFMPDQTEPKLEPVRVPTTQEVVYQTLENAIIAGRIRPGERLVAEQLARQLGVSRMPVRDAIGRLEARSFITTQPGKGVVVNELSEKNLAEILDIRLTLETKAARYAARNRTEKTLQALEESQVLYLEARRTMDPDELLRANRFFHFTLYRQAGMPILETLIDQLWNRVSPYHHIMFRQTALEDPETGPSYHRKMIDAMARRDADEVCHWLTVDITEATEFVVEVFHFLKGAPGVR